MSETSFCPHGERWNDRDPCPDDRPVTAADGAARSEYGDGPAERCPKCGDAGVVIDPQKHAEWHARGAPGLALGSDAGDGPALGEDARRALRAAAVVVCHEMHSAPVTPPCRHCFRTIEKATRALLVQARADGAAEGIDAAHLDRQREWSRRTFGPGCRTLGVLDHIRKELAEIEADPLDLGEWVDVLILAFDGAWRAGWEPTDIIAAIKAKQAKNEARVWPDWRQGSEDVAIEHDRSYDAILSEALRDLHGMDDPS